MKQTDACSERWYPFLKKVEQACLVCSTFLVVKEKIYGKGCDCFLVGKQETTRVKRAKARIMIIMVLGVPSEKRASKLEDKIPLPYCRDPNNAEAAPVCLESTAFKADALAQAEIIPFMEKTKNIGMAIPQIPTCPK